MAGCFGNSQYDRWLEGQLNRYLDSTEVPAPCEDCEHVDDCECCPDECKTGALVGDDPADLMD